MDKNTSNIYNTLQGQLDAILPLEVCKMKDNKFIGWFSLGLFILAILVLLYLASLFVFPNIYPNFAINAHLLLFASGVLAFLAALLGFASRNTPQGKIGGIGGLIIFIAVAILLSFTLVTRVEMGMGSVLSLI